MYWRECYKGGNTKSGEVIFEAHAFCNCGECTARRLYRKESRNEICVTVTDKKLISKAEEFIENWKCKDGSKAIKTEYVTFSEV